MATATTAGVSTGVQLPTGHPLALRLTLAQIAAATFDDWFARGVAMFDDDKLLAVGATDDGIGALIRSSADDTTYGVQLDVSGIRNGRLGPVTASCECPVSNRHQLAWCKHRVALALTVLHAAGHTGFTGGSAADRDRQADELTFAAFDLADNVPPGLTVMSTAGRVRHLAYPPRKDGTRRLRCNTPVGQLHTADPTLPICRRCPF
jgi:hypothetical protein